MEAVEDQKQELENYLATGNGQTKNPLHILRKWEQLPVDVSFLEKTQVGILVGKLRKSSNEEIASAAKRVLVKWKDVVLQSSKANLVEKGQDFSELKKENGTFKHKLKRDISDLEEGNDLRKERRPSDGDNISQQSVRLPYKMSSRGNSVRDKCAEMIYTALISDDPLEDAEYPSALAAKIEQYIHEEFPFANSRNSADEKSYKAKVRSRYLNLKDRANPTLRIKILNAEIDAESFVKMSAQELASEERRAMDEALQKQNMFKSRGFAENEAETDQFRCGKCKQRKTKYFQLQTRSADEPMTTFVTCVVCNHRWKFC